MSSSLQALSRAQGQMLLLLLAAVMVLAPHALHLPLPLSLAITALLLWRAMITVRGHRQPSLWLLAPLALAGIGAVASSYGTLLGRDPGVAMLALLLALKSLEMHGRRDVHVLVFLGFFLLLANFFHHQGILSAAWMLATVLVLLAGLLSSRYGAWQPPLRQRLGLLARMLALAVPLAAILFLAMPRVQGPLWGKADALARSGLSETLRPGAIAALALSDETVLTARFATPLPPQDALYWRAVVLDGFDGATWRRSASSSDVDRIDISQSGPASNYEVLLAASGQPRILALDLPRSVERLAGNPYLVSPALEISTRHPITAPVRYRASSLTTYRLQPALSPQQLQPWLQLPAGFNPRSLAWARQLRTGGQHGQRRLSPQQAVQAVLAHFHQAPFRYTLQPPLLGKDSVDDFLFGSRAGFCEHYASAFTVLMRAMGIPARIVTGYQGGRREADGVTLSVRQLDAHAWSEVWLAGQGWVRFDPTAAVAPLRVERDLAAALPETATAPQGDWRALIGLGAQGAALSAWQQRWQQAEQGWQRWIVDATPQRQRDLFARLFAMSGRTVALVCAMLASLVALAALLVLWRRQQHQSHVDPLDSLYARFCALQARRGHSRAPHEGPHGYAARLAASAATPETHAAIARFLAIYAAIKYGNASPDQHQRARRALRRLLNQCR